MSAEGSTVGESSFFLRAAIMKDNFLIMKSVVRGSIIGLTGNFIKANGKQIKCMVQECYSGPMGRNILVYSKKIREKVKE